LELLEELLANYQGTLLLVSHDRAFVDNVVTSTLVFEGEGKIQEYIGGYQAWLNQRKATAAMNTPSGKIEEPSLAEKSKQIKKLSYKDQKELDEFPKLIEKLETKQSELQALITNTEFYKQEQSEITKKLAECKKIEEELEAAYARWAELEALNEAVKK